MNATAVPLQVVEDSRTVRQRAIDRWLDAPAHAKPSGAALAREFEMSPTWGRQVRHEARRVAADREDRPVPEDVPELPAPPVVEPTPEVVKTLNEQSVEPPPRLIAAGHGFATWVSTSGAKTLVRVAAAIGSYGHQFKLAQAVGEGWLAYVWPLIADALVWRCLQRSTIVARLVLAVALVVSIGANVVLTDSTEGALVAAWPPAALLLDHLVENSKRTGWRREK